MARQSPDTITKKLSHNASTLHKNKINTSLCIQSKNFKLYKVLVLFLLSTSTKYEILKIFTLHLVHRGRVSLIHKILGIYRTYFRRCIVRRAVNRHLLIARVLYKLQTKLNLIFSDIPKVAIKCYIPIFDGYIGSRHINL